MPSRDWSEVGERLRRSRAPERPARTYDLERCEGCQRDLARGTLVTVLVDREDVAGVAPNGQPVYHYSAYRSLCGDCRKARP